MQRICDICHKAEATRFENVMTDGRAFEYAYCEACYSACLKRGVMPLQLAQMRRARLGLECDECGWTYEKFKDTYMFGCPECYTQMRQIACEEAAALVGRERMMPDIRLTDEDAENLSLYAISSRVRFARNVRGLRFPATLTDGEDVHALLRGAFDATKGLFEAEVYPMRTLGAMKKKALIEGHYISPALAEHPLGALILQKNSEYGISVMLNEEDHIRAQCVLEGMSLNEAYRQLKRYDEKLAQTLDIAYDAQLGYLTACPTNLGAAMRASVLLFLPALNRMCGVKKVFKDLGLDRGLTVRGYFGEGSEDAYDMFQISNQGSIDASEESILQHVVLAAAKLCRLEREALKRLMAMSKCELLDGIYRSYGTLKGAYMLGGEELMSLIADVKLGVILGVLPIKDMRVLNKLIWLSTSSLDILTEGISETERSVKRARLVREIVTED